MQIYNSLTNKLEEFKPLKRKRIKNVCLWTYSL